MPSVLQVENVHTYRGPAHILRGISMLVNEGETVCFVGRNGAGKTTTMENIMGTLPVRTGKVIFRGQEITRLGPHVRARLGIGYAPDDSGIFPELTAGENLNLSSWLARSSNTQGNTRTRNEGEEIYQLFPELRRLLQRRGLYLSGGEKKMVAIARAMALRPSILLLDEAFEGLAPLVVNRFADAVQQIKSMGVSMLIAESNLTTAARLADRLYVIDRGEIIFEGPPKKVFEAEEVMRTIRG